MVDIWDEMSFISRKFPNEVRFLSSSDDITWLDIHRHVGLLFATWQKSPIKTVRVMPCKPPMSDQESSSSQQTRFTRYLRERQWKRERICLPLSWTCSSGCFVRISSDGCCFNLFSPHFVFVSCFFKKKPIRFSVPFSSLWLYADSSSVAVTLWGLPVRNGHCYDQHSTDSEIVFGCFHSHMNIITLLII